MISFRILALAFLMAAGTALTAAPAFADPPPWAHGGEHRDRGDREDNGRAQDRGIISGEIVGVNYTNGTMLLQSGSRRVEITVLPSTNIFAGRSGFATLADLARGRRVDVWTSQSGGRLFAQMIRIH
jgi:hypothetical protein